MEGYKIMQIEILLNSKPRHDFNSFKRLCSANKPFIWNLSKKRYLTSKRITIRVLQTNGTLFLSIIILLRTHCAERNTFCFVLCFWMNFLCHWLTLLNSKAALSLKKIKKTVRSCYWFFSDRSFWWHHRKPIFLL